MNYYPLKELDLKREVSGKEEEEEEEETNLQKFIKDYYYYILIILVIIIFLLINNLLNYLLQKKKNFNTIQTGGKSKLYSAYRGITAPVRLPLKGVYKGAVGAYKLPGKIDKMVTSSDYRDARKKMNIKNTLENKRKRIGKANRMNMKILSSLGSSSRYGSYGLVYTAGSVIFTILIGLMVLIVFAPSLGLVAVIFFSFRMIIPKILELKEL